MKYLKTFESKDEPFQFIHPHLWCDLTTRSIDFTPSEIKKIKDSNRRLADLRVETSTDDNLIYYTFLTNSNIDINCLPDEWYLVWHHDIETRTPSRYYKCDQLDGLLLCIEKIFRDK